MKILDKMDILRETQKSRDDIIIGIVCFTLFAAVFSIALFIFAHPIAGILVGVLFCGLAFLLFKPAESTDCIKNDNYYILFLPVVSIDETNDTDGTYMTLRFPYGHSKSFNGHRRGIYVGEYYYIVVSGKTNKAVAFFSRNHYELSNTLMHKLIRAYK